MYANLLHHPAAPLCILCAVAWLLVLVCGFLFPPADPQ